jgi:UDP-N-acetylglucosamine 4,6-dehydratase/5-epimerase
VVRYGNVIGSRGSFIPSLIGTLRTEKKAYVTHPEMSRFWMSPQQAASFVRSSVEKGPGLHLPTEIRASSILKMVAAVADFAGVDIYDIKEIGIRPGEKLHETLRTEEEGGLIRSDDRDVQFDPKSLVQFVRNVMMGEA